MVWPQRTKPDPYECPCRLPAAGFIENRLSKRWNSANRVPCQLPGCWSPLNVPCHQRSQKMLIMWPRNLRHGSSPLMNRQKWWLEKSSFTFTQEPLQGQNHIDRFLNPLPLCLLFWTLTNGHLYAGPVSKKKGFGFFLLRETSNVFKFSTLSKCFNIFEFTLLK